MPLWSAPGRGVQRFGPDPRVEQPLRMEGRNDPVAFPREHEEGHFEGRRPRERVERVPEEQRYGDEGVVPPADTLQAVEGGDEHDAEHRPGRGKLHRDPTAEAPSEHDDAIRVDVVACRELVVDGEGVRDECGLARPPLAQPVAAVVEGRERPRGEGVRLEHLSRHLLGVAAKVDDEPRSGRLPGRCVPEPAVQARAVPRPHLELGGAGQLPESIPRALRERPGQKDEAFLDQVEQRAERGRTPRAR